MHRSTTDRLELTPSHPDLSRMLTSQKVTLDVSTPLKQDKELKKTEKEVKETEKEVKKTKAGESSA